MEAESLTCSMKEFAQMIGVCEDKAREICAGPWHPPMVPAQVSGKGKLLIYRKGIEPWLERICETGALPEQVFGHGGR